MNPKLHQIINQKSIKNFPSIALEVFKYQSKNNKVYRKYIDCLDIDPKSITSLDDVPFMPVGFFKSHKVMTGNWQEEGVFESSGTTGTTASKHLVRDFNLYRENVINIFKYFYGEPRSYHILALLPSYLERGNSSLVTMAGYLIKHSDSPFSGFFLHNFSELHDVLNKAKNTDRKVLLIGVTFALMDFAAQFQPDLNNCIVMETGGMKGRRDEITREEVHDYLKEQLNLASVHSEYGMTEMMSQAYSLKDGFFKSPPCLKIRIRDLYDPFAYVPASHTGVIQVIDLANVDTCSFIETEDLGFLSDEYHFSVIGRVDNSEIRGCNLLVNL